MKVSIVPPAKSYFESVCHNNGVLEFKAYSSINCLTGEAIAYPKDKPIYNIIRLDLSTGLKIFPTQAWKYLIVCLYVHIEFHIDFGMGPYI